MPVHAGFNATQQQEPVTVEHCQWQAGVLPSAALAELGLGPQGNAPKCVDMSPATVTVERAADALPDEYLVTVALDHDVVRKAPVNSPP